MILNIILKSIGGPSRGAALGLAMVGTAACSSDPSGVVGDARISENADGAEASDRAPAVDSALSPASTSDSRPDPDGPRSADVAMPDAAIAPAGADNADSGTALDSAPDATGAADAAVDRGATAVDTRSTDTALQVVGDDPADLPLAALSPAQLDTFNVGDELFGTAFRINDGLGPLYIRTSCAACHVEGGRGPGSVTKVQILDAITRAAVPNPSELPWGNTERPYAVAGATRPLLAPVMPAAGHVLLMSRRIGPTVMGRGYIEAIADAEIEKAAAAQANRTDGIRGRINRVTYHSKATPGVAVPHTFDEKNLIGRFGLKARVTTLDDFAADAFQGDMGMTSPLRPDEHANPDGLKDDGHPGIDVDAETVITVASYVRTIAIPPRDAAQAAGPGPALFESSRCSVCHIPSLMTRADYPLKILAGIAAPVYSDLLLHDMGDALADGQLDETAGPRDWRTAPLIALRFQRSFLHDGRARTVEEAILGHAGTGSEANDSVDRFKKLSKTEQTALTAFVLSL